MAKEKFYFCCVLFIVFNSWASAEGRGVGLFCVASKEEWVHWKVKCLKEMGSFLWEVNFSSYHHSSKCFEGNAWSGADMAWMTSRDPLEGCQAIPSCFINFLLISSNNSWTIFGFAETRYPISDRICFPVEVESYRIGGFLSFEK